MLKIYKLSLLKSKNDKFGFMKNKNRSQKLTLFWFSIAMATIIPKRKNNQA
jgi:hypothetical protein